MSTSFKNNLFENDSLNFENNFKSKSQIKENIKNIQVLDFKNDRLKKKLIHMAELLKKM